MVMEVAKVLHKYQVTLPKEVREKLDLSIGDQVIFVETEHGLFVRKITSDLIEKMMSKN